MKNIILSPRGAPVGSKYDEKHRYRSMPATFLTDSDIQFYREFVQNVALRQVEKRLALSGLPEQGYSHAKWIL
ncbi:hypothetical protein [Cohnella terricola]|uniref:Uncharacterized protein n=1 Tax=Cohnella terricola TaxID=1289167 RepID=A0A559J868_9BACL|nr:hypothetical protein [Cohnella terricola]TVX96078.1 hypothetical protein FPZ45_21870 [Cohnella terricola]